MPSSEERERAARAGIEAYAAGEMPRLLAGLTEDVEVYVPADLANAGTFHGHDGFTAWLGNWTDVWEEIEAEVTAAIPVGERHVVTEIHQVGRGRAGIKVTMDAAFLFEVRDDGLVSYLALFLETEQALERAREREPA